LREDFLSKEICLQKKLWNILQNKLKGKVFLKEAMKDGNLYPVDFYLKNKIK